MVLKINSQVPGLLNMEPDFQDQLKFALPADKILQQAISSVNFTRSGKSRNISSAESHSRLGIAFQHQNHHQTQNIRAGWLSGSRFYISPTWTHSSFNVQKMLPIPTVENAMCFIDPNFNSPSTSCGEQLEQNAERHPRQYFFISNSHRKALSWHYPTLQYYRQSEVLVFNFVPSRCCILLTVECCPPHPGLVETTFCFLQPGWFNQTNQTNHLQDCNCTVHSAQCTHSCGQGAQCFYK